MEQAQNAIDEVTQLKAELGAVKQERDELHSVLHSLLLAAKCHAGVSEHLMRRCEEAEQLIDKKMEYKDK